MQTNKTHLILFIMGVSGSGKTTIGMALSQATGIPFYDADAFHPAPNIAKMQSGQPLTDEDRYGWLESINRFVCTKSQTSSVIFACSALKESYRRLLMQQCEDRCRWVYLNGSYDLIQSRLTHREGHFMPASLLPSQFNALEIPVYAWQADTRQPVESLVNQIIEHFNLPQNHE